MNTMGMNSTGTGAATGTHTIDSNESPDYNNKDRDISPSNLISTVSTFYNLTKYTNGR